MTSSQVRIGRIRTSELKDSTASKYTSSNDLNGSSDDKSYKKDIKELVFLSAPIIVTYLFEYLPSVLCIKFAGRFPSEDAALNIAGAAMASIYFNLFGAVFVMGPSMALDTLCSQAVGAGRPTEMSFYVQTCGILLLITCVPLAFINWYSEPVLLFAGQKPEIAAAAAAFIRVQFWSLPFLVGYECMKRPLQSQSNLYPLIVSAAMGIFVVLISGYLLCVGPLVQLGFGVQGAALARVLCAASQFGTVAYFTFGSKQGKETNGKYWDTSTSAGIQIREAFRLSRINEVLRLGIPGFLMLFFEWGAFEIQGLLAGLIDPKEISIGSYSIVTVVVSSTFMFYLGTGVATSVLVGRSIGEGDAFRARRFAKIGIALVLCLATILGGGMIVYQASFAPFFTRDHELIEATTRLVKFGAIFQLVDGAQTVCGGSFRGVGIQALGALLNFASFYVVGIPLGLLFAFYFQFGVSGLYIGLSGGLLLFCLSGIYVLFVRDDWQFWVDLRKERMDKEDNGQSKAVNENGAHKETTPLIGISPA